MRKALTPEDGGPEIFEEEIFEGPGWVHRWVERPDGSMDLVETLLTPEYLLNPQLGDQMVQGALHAAVTQMLTDLLQRHFLAQEDVLVFSDVKLLWGLGRLRLRQPAPDVTVVRGVRDRNLGSRGTFHVVREGVRPCLVIEIVSRQDSRVRRTDLVEKVKVYQKVGIAEYLIVDPPGPATQESFQMTFYRLDARGHYRQVAPDAEGRLLSEQAGVMFGVSPEGGRLLLFDAATGERLLTSAEEEAARRAAEAEVHRLRAELERLRKSGG